MLRSLLSAIYTRLITDPVTGYNRGRRSVLEVIDRHYDAELIRQQGTPYPPVSTKVLEDLKKDLDPTFESRFQARRHTQGNDR
jgi:hypothetical protein